MLSQCTDEARLQDVKKQFLHAIEEMPIAAFVDTSVITSLHERIIKQCLVPHHTVNGDCDSDHEMTSIETIDLTPPNKRCKGDKDKLNRALLAQRLQRAPPLIDMTSPVQISLITLDDIYDMKIWATSKLSQLPCKAFGVPWSQMTSKSYWKSIACETGFKVTINGQIIGFIYCTLNSLDANGVPAHYGATKRSRIVHRNLACLSYIKGSVESSVKGCMRKAVELAIEWLLDAEPALAGVMTVIRRENSNYESSIPETREYIRRSRALSEAVGMKELSTFFGTRMGLQNAFLLLRQEDSASTVRL